MPIPLGILEWPEPKGRGGGCRSPLYHWRRTGPVTIRRRPILFSLRPRRNRPVLVASSRLDLRERRFGGMWILPSRRGLAWIRDQRRRDNACDGSGEGDERLKNGRDALDRTPRRHGPVQRGTGQGRHPSGRG